MADDRISPTRWAVFRMVAPEHPPTESPPYVWLKKSAAPDLRSWADRHRDRLERLAPGTGLAFDAELSDRWGTRSTKSSLQSLRSTIVHRLAVDGFTVVPDHPVVAYAIELDATDHYGRQRLYVGVTSELDTRLAEHREELPGGKPAGRAVVRHGYGRLREDLTEDTATVPTAAAAELEAQVSAMLTHRGFRVHGDGAKRRPVHSRFIHGASWDDLQRAWRTANDIDEPEQPS